MTPPTPKLYLVGGAVRDTLLQRPVKDRDYVLVGGTEADIVAKWPSAKRVGKAFPVFLIDGVGEVALARRERKTGPRHRDFAVEFGPEVTLEEDLSRRDLTFNAMAIGDDGQVVDPFGGIADLAARRLRHVSDAFADDVLRLYRLARFAAELEFDIDDGTMSICRGLPKHELLALPRDRVRTEFLKALAAQRPDRFISVLRVCDQLDVHFEEIAALANVPAGPPQHHGEGDALVHTCMVLCEAAKLSSSVYVRFAALLHDLGRSLSLFIIGPPVGRTGASLGNDRRHSTPNCSRSGSPALPVTRFMSAAYHSRPLRKLLPQLAGYPARPIDFAPPGSAVYFVVRRHKCPSPVIQKYRTVMEYRWT